ncbi:MAG TPA: hypothetical protein VIL85_05930 [Thermomicrobiales bacterium]|jgi:hypothetical protein
MGRWRRSQPRNQGRNDAEMPGEQVWSLTAMGVLIGAILGWLAASGALPHPAFLPIPENAVLTTTLACAACGAVISGSLGLLADLSDRWQAADTITDESHAEH